MNKEQEILLKIQKMCEESLEPSIFEKWEEVKVALCTNRKALEIEFEFVGWAEKETYEAWLIGEDITGLEYEATGIMGGGEIQRVYNIKKTDIIISSKIGVPDCYKCDPLKASQTYAPITGGNYQCKCGNEYTIPQKD